MPTGSPLAFALSVSLLATAVMAKAPAFIAAAVANPNRPAEDKARDAARKPADMLVFAQVKRGQTVADFMPAKGYFTRLFSNAVGLRGHVYAVTPQLLLDAVPKDKLPPSIAGEPGRGNVIDVVANKDGFGVPPDWLDLAWTAQNYHDVHIWVHADGAEALDKAIYAALKPGGVFVVVDHSGVKGQDDATMATLHRIDEDLVKREVVAAGFVLEAESDVLRNPDDTRTLKVFDPSIRGHTDQFVLRFRKPAAG